MSVGWGRGIARYARTRGYESFRFLILNVVALGRNSGYAVAFASI